MTNPRSRAFSCRNQYLKFRYGTKKFFETVSAFTGARIRVRNEEIERRLILVVDSPLMLVHPVRARFQRIGQSLVKFQHGFRFLEEPEVERVDFAVNGRWIETGFQVLGNGLRAYSLVVLQSAPSR